jgi:endoglucanase
MKLAALIAKLLLLLGLASCGGGGGNGGGTASTPPSSSPTPPAAPPPPPAAPAPPTTSPAPSVTVVGGGAFITVDQFGYLSSQQKIAVLRDPITGYDSDDAYQPGATIQVINTAGGTVAFAGAPTQWNNGATDTSSGDRVWRFDFSSVTTPGNYEILDVERNVRSPRFEIGVNVYRPILIQAVRTFFYQRAGHAKAAQFAGAGWADAASHLGPLQDANARRYNAPNDAATERDLRGGWYDAGDFNKYTSWTAGYVVDLLHTYSQNQPIWTDDFNIPESGNGVPDLLDEIKWGLDWLVRMQNSDGSVLSILGVSHASPPSSATGPSLYGDASTSATLSTAMAFAYAARIFDTLNTPTFDAYAADLAQRAERAWDWAIANPNVIFRNNDSASGTGGLGAGQQETDDAGRAERRLVAAIYLFDLTGDVSYREYVDAHYTEAPMFASWWLSPFNAGVTRPLLHYASLSGATPQTSTAIRTRYAELWARADYGGWGAVNAQRDPYGAFISDYTWGSNAVKGLAGGMFTDEALYGLGTHSAVEAMHAGAAYLHYLHGVNPLGKVYLSNMGNFGAENSVDQFFHSWFADGSAIWDSVRDSTYGPAPGFVVGGPNPSSYGWDDRCPGISALCGASPPAPPSNQPAQKAYLDFNTGWPLNSWSITENSNGYQTSYIRLLARYVQ